jgi:hypothetical protein
MYELRGTQSYKNCNPLQDMGKGETSLKTQGKTKPREIHFRQDL